MRDKLIYVAPVKASFVIQDIEWLSRHVDVTPKFFKLKYKYLLPFKMLKLFFQLFFLENAPVLVSFGGYHSLIAALVCKIKGTPCYIILNGTDSVSIPEWSYGHLRKVFLRKICCVSYKLSKKLFPVSSSLIFTINNYSYEEPHVLGLNSFLEQNPSDFKVIPNGFDVDFWKVENFSKKPKSIVTVVGSENRVAHKGLDLLIECSQRLPEWEIHVVGLSRIGQSTPSNVIFHGFLGREELRQVYEQCEYYAQLSIWEGFGCALCEAMLCGCIPIVSEVNMLPEIIGETGHVLKKRDVHQLEELLKTIKVDTKQSPREQIVSNYTMNHRVDMLLHEIFKNNVYKK